MEYIDPTQVSAQHYAVLLENEEVRVLEMRLRAGERDARHSHPAETVYFVRGGRADIEADNGDAVDVDLPDSHVMWHAPWTHQVTNVGATDIYAVIVERKTSDT